MIPNYATVDLDRGKRDEFSSILLKDFVTHFVVVESPSPSIISLSSTSGTPYSIAHYNNCKFFSMNYQKFNTAFIANTYLKAIKEAMKDDGWKASM